MVLELLGASVLRGGDQVPHEAFDFVVSTVMDQAVGQQGSADGLHVPLSQLLLEAAVREDVLPSTPPGKKHMQTKPFEGAGSKNSVFDSHQRARAGESVTRPAALLTCLDVDPELYWFFGFIYCW